MNDTIFVDTQCIFPISFARGEYLVIPSSLLVTMFQHIPSKR